jgi:acyl-CoA synthetase (AMP-forming)/AMP-acid ligase II/NAD(P)-dependent dehydrogenase (short-subunit alcohol dehydrogenase family)
MSSQRTIEAPVDRVPPDDPQPGHEGVARFVLTGERTIAGNTAIVDRSRGGEPRRWSYSELASAVAGVAGGLRSAGLGDGEVVAVLTENSAEFVIAYHGVLAAGGVVLPLDPRSTEAEWTAELGRCHASAIIVEARLWSVPPSLPRVVRIGCEARGREIGWDELVRAGGDATIEVPRVRGGDRPAVLMSSSGTLGVPKKVVVSHHNLAAGLVQIDSVHRLGSGDTVLCVGPLRHIYGMQMAMNAALRAGATLVIASTRFDVGDLMGVLAQDEVTVAYLVPSVITEIAALTEHVVPAALRLVVSGGAPLPASAATGCSERLGLPVVQGFGMTEAGCVSFTPDDRPGPLGTVGVVLPGTAARFVDPETGLDTRGEHPGELWLRGPQITPGHLDEHGVVVPARDENGWFHTGDLAILDSQRYLRVVGRIKSLIKYKGHQVSPAELEEILVAHPAVSDALVVGQPDPVAGELPKAYVVLVDDVPLADVTAHVAATVPPHKRIRLVERVREIPRSATGKPIRPPALRILVTDGGRGLGRVLTTALVAAGGHVLAIGRDLDSLESTAASVSGFPGRIECFQADLTEPGALTAVTHAAEKAFGGIDVLVNNAAVAGPLGLTWRVDPREWSRVMEVNLVAAHRAAHAMLPMMIDRGFGRVVNIVSCAGREVWPNASAYAVSNAALIALTANLAAELRGVGVSVVAFDPGMLDIGITRAHFDRGHAGNPPADGDLDFAPRARDDGAVSPVTDATKAFSRIVTGGADTRSGHLVTVAEILRT